MKIRFNRMAQVYLWVVPLILLGVVGPAQAARYHVRSSGTLVSGPSMAGVWLVENCYPDLATAAAAAAPADSIFLYSEAHQLDASIVLPSFLGGDHLSGNWIGASIVCGAGAQMVIPAERSRFTARELIITSDGHESDLAAFLLEGGYGASDRFTFENCYFHDNKASDMNSGGGSCIAARGTGNGAFVDIMSCLFIDNSCHGLGGAILIQNGYDVEIQNSDFMNNDSLYGYSLGAGRGGAIAMVSPSASSFLTISHSNFDGNRAWGPGGTIFIDDGSLTMLDCRLDNSESAMEGSTEWSAGAGILMRRTDGAHIDYGFLTVERCHFQGNRGHLDINPWAGDGGAILVKGIDDRYVDVSVSDCTFENNYNAQGAGLYIGRFATGNVIRCRFLNNTAFLQGGGSFKGGAFEANFGEAAYYHYCEFSGNRAGLDFYGNDSDELGRGGAFSTRLYPRGEFYNCTFYNNEAHGPSSEGDAIMLPNEGGTFTSDLMRCAFVNSVFYGETGNSRQVITRTGAISRVSSCAFQSGEVQTGGIDADGTIVLTGSPFLGTSVLYPALGSSLVDAAMDTGQEWDLLGNPVPYGDGPDIGAFELQDLSPALALLPGRSLLSAYPNPFNPQTVLKFELARPGLAQLDVYDLAGARVKSLVQEQLEAGVYNHTWSGQNEEGQRMPSGIYFARLVVDGVASTQKLTLVQ